MPTEVSLRALRGQPERCYRIGMTETAQPTLAIAEYSPTRAALAELRTKYGKPEVYDVTTTAGMSEAKKARAELRTCRLALEEKRVEIKAPALEACRQIDAQAAELRAQIEALEDPIHAKIKAEEDRKEQEKAAAEAAKRALLETAQRQCNELRALVVKAVDTPVANVAKLIAEAKAFAVPNNEHRADVETVRDQTLSQLDNMLARAKAREDEAKRLEEERADLERLRAKAAEEERKRQAATEAERKKLEAEAEAQRTKIAAEAKAAQDKIDAERRKADAERAAADAKAKAERDAADAQAAKVRAEQERQAREAREKEDAKLRAERAKLDAERDAQEALAKKKRDEEEAAAAEKARKLREAAEAKERAAEAARIKSLTGRAMLGEFVARYGNDPEFVGIGGTIEAWLAESRPVEQTEVASPAPSKPAAKKKGAA
jgi:colicin import membrane protein